MEKYIINNNTLALLPAKQLEYDTTVIDIEQTLHTRQTPMHIMSQSCLAYLSVYDGRRGAVIHHTRHKERIVLPGNACERRIFFPTHGTRHIDCCWIAYHHVVSFETLESDPKLTKVTLSNGKTTTVPISARSFHTQMLRSFEVLQIIKRIFPKTT